MVKNLIINILIATGLFFLGWFLNDWTQEYTYDLGRIIAVGGIGYGIISTIYILFAQGIPLFNKIVDDRSKIKAQGMLIKYKELLDKGILTKAEFEIKAAELKVRI